MLKQTWEELWLHTNIKIHKSEPLVVNSAEMVMLLLLNHCISFLDFQFCFPAQLYGISELDSRRKYRYLSPAENCFHSMLTLAWRSNRVSKLFLLFMLICFTFSYMSEALIIDISLISARNFGYTIEIYVPYNIYHLSNCWLHSYLFRFAASVLKLQDLVNKKYVDFVYWQAIIYDIPLVSSSSSL